MPDLLYVLKEVLNTELALFEWVGHGAMYLGLQA
jgi:hypothetical protein